MPPESVTTAVARSCKARNSIYGSGSRKSRFACVNSKIGNTLTSAGMHREDHLHLTVQFQQVSQNDLQDAIIVLHSPDDEG